MRFSKRSTFECRCTGCEICTELAKLLLPRGGAHQVRMIEKAIIRDFGQASHSDRTAEYAEALAKAIVHHHKLGRMIADANSD